MQKRGEIYWADLFPRSGSEQKGRRPILIMSNDGFNQEPRWNSLIVVPISTSASQAGRGGSIVEIPEKIFGLAKKSAAICHQVTTIDRSKILDYIGTLSADWLAQVEAALLFSLEITLNSEPFDPFSLNLTPSPPRRVNTAHRFRSPSARQPKTR